MTNFEKPTIPATSTNEYNPAQQQPWHGQEYNGYRFDTTLGQWMPINPDATIAGAQKKPTGKQLLIGSVAVGALILGAIGVANLVAKDEIPKDQQYVQALAEDANVYPVTTDSYLISSGQIICSAFRDGDSFATIRKQIFLSNDVDMSQADAWVGIAADFYCPQYN